MKLGSEERRNKKPWQWAVTMFEFAPVSMGKGRSVASQTLLDSTTTS
jgi:hypothetical protein